MLGQKIVVLDGVLGRYILKQLAQQDWETEFLTLRRPLLVGKG